MHEPWWKHSPVVGALFACALLVSSCAADMGHCDMTLLGGSAVVGNAAPTKGQLVVQNTCAAGRCHSQTATGNNRVGAPAGLDFDVVPFDSSVAEINKITHGAKVVHDHRSAMWAQVEAGEMPPKGQTMLNASDKESLRNWLACGAPVIAAPAVGPVSADWTAVYTSLATMCTGCHGSQTYVGAGNGFQLGDANSSVPATVCTAYHNVISKPAVTTMGMCASSGLSLVVPGQPDNSLLLRKIEGTQPCGMAMPYGTSGLGPSSTTSMALRQWIMAGAVPPSGCQ
jgi:hypothetical protein